MSHSDESVNACPSVSDILSGRPLADVKRQLSSAVSLVAGSVHPERAEKETA
jgi:hypothetical protein